MIGKTIGGRYRVDALIGSGGMAVVYRATDLRTKRVVAIKLLKEQFGKSSEFLGRFDREAVASAKMRHPNIVALLDTGEEEGMRYLVIEYVQGMTLKELVRERGKIPPDEAVKITLYILSALEHAHEKNIIHRDIKPQNILVDDNGRIKIADFGIAKLADATTLTLSDNSVMGSVHYFSPEQAKGQSAGASSDLYSTGVVLYEMLTGRVPFDGDTPYEVARQHIESQHKATSYYAPEIPAALEEVLTKALCKDLSQRYESAGQMSADLRKVRKNPMGGFVVMRPSQQAESFAKEPRRKRSTTRRRPKRRRLRWVLSVMLSLAALGFLGVTAYNLIYDAVSHATMPDMQGMEENAALRLLERSGLHATVLRAQSEMPVGQVFEQEPEAGVRIAKSQTITLRVSQGTGKLTIPDVLGLPQQQAEDALNAAGFEVGDVMVSLSEMASGLVFDQMPGAGAVVGGETVVDIYISGGLVVVPEMKGMTQDQAKAQLESVGLLLGKISYMSVAELEKDGQVQSQYPAMGERVFPRTEIDLSIARADHRPYKAEVTVTVKVPPNGVHVRVTLVNAEGEESDQYAAMYALEGDNEMKVPLRSAVPGDMQYRVYLDNQLTTEAAVTLR